MIFHDKALAAMNYLPTRLGDRVHAGLLIPVIASLGACTPELEPNINHKVSFPYLPLLFISSPLN
jgi:hypothetical protein